MSGHHYAIFKSLNLRDIVGSKRRLLQVSAKASLADALRKLNEHKVLSLAIYDESKKEFTALLNMFDIVSYIVTSSSVEGAIAHCVSEVPGINQESAQMPILKISVDFESVLAKFSHGYHRILMDLGDGFTLLTQSDIARWLYDHISMLDETALNQSLADAGLASRSKKVISANHKEKVVDAFRDMFRHDVRAVAVVDDRGKVIGNLSSSDFRGISADKMVRLDASWCALTWGRKCSSAGA